MLDILKLEFGKIYIPESVYREVVVEGKGKIGSEEVSKANWIYPKSIKDTIRRNKLRIKFGPGLPGCVATGLTREEAEFNMQKAIEMHVRGLLQDKLRVPKPQAIAEYLLVK